MISGLSSTRRRLLVVFVSCMVLAAGILVWRMTLVTEAAMLDPHPGLVGWWRFDEGNGTVVEDSSGNGNDGTVHGATWMDGKYGQALQLDGADDHVEVPSIDTGVISISLWFNLSSLTGNDQYLISKGLISAPKRTYDLILLDSSRKICWYTAHTNNDFQQLYSTSTIPLNTWVHLVVIADGTKKYIYINGSLDASADWAKTIQSSSYTEHIGRGRFVSPRHVHGTVDEVRIYNRPLLATDIENLFQKGPDFSSRLLAKVPKGTTEFIATLSWQGVGSTNVTIESPSETYTEHTIPVYQKTSYSSSDGEILNIKRLSVSVTALSHDEDWYIILESDDLENYRITVEIQR